MTVQREQKEEQKSKGKILGLIQSIGLGPKSVRNEQARSANTGKR